MNMQLSKHSASFNDEIVEYTRKQYNDFKDYQVLAINTLQEIHRICEQHNIVYYLAFGSLLGAIRDGGQIPWDYDIDILVPYKYHDDLLKLLDTDLSDGYHYETRFRSNDCRHYTVRVAPKGYDCAILHVDIFWLIGEDSDPKLQKKHFHTRQLFYKSMIYKHPIRADVGELSIIGSIKRIIKFFKYYIIPEKLLESKYLRLLNEDFDSSEFCTYNGRNLNLFRSEWFGTPQVFTTVDGIKLYIPEDYDRILRSTYGDYMKIPDIKKRINEFQKSLVRLELYSRSGM